MKRVDAKDASQVELHTPSWHHKRRMLSNRVLLIGILLFIMGSMTVSSLGYMVGTTHYQRDLLLAKEGMQHLLRGRELLLTLARSSLDTHVVAGAEQEFTSALGSFTRLENDLKFVPAFAIHLPWYGHHLHTALHLVPLALAFSQAGVASCDILNVLIARLHNPLYNQSHGIIATDLPILAQNLSNIQASLTKAVNEVDQLQPSDMQFDSRMNNLMDTAHRDLPKLQVWLDSIAKLLPAAPVLLGINAPTHYLIEILDSTELRPGGGFIGNYGAMTVSEGQLVAAHITDTDLLDHPFYSSGKGIPFPPAYRWFDIARGNWGLRDSNLDADFPTNARHAESIYTSEGGSIPFQGVIAITPTFIQRTLAITGPITIPEYHEKVDAQNLIERIHYHQLGPRGEGPDYIASPDGHSSLRKHFTALLAEHLLVHVRQAAASQATKFLQLLADMVQTKDLQLYFNNPNAEMQFHNHHLDAAIQTPSGDDLFVVDANIAANKANNSIKSTLTDNVNIDTEGNAIHHTTLHYVWPTSGQNYGFPLYRDYVQVYVPKGSILQAQTGWQRHEHNQTFGHAIWAGFFTLTNAQTHTITLTWRVPHAATRHGNVWHYQTMLQKQAGVAWVVHVQVILPSCAKVTAVPSEKKTTNAQNLALNQILTKNTSLEIDYVCP